MRRTAGESRAASLRQAPCRAAPPGHRGPPGLTSLAWPRTNDRVRSVFSLSPSHLRLPHPLTPLSCSPPPPWTPHPPPCWSLPLPLLVSVPSLPYYTHLTAKPGSGHRHGTEPRPKASSAPIPLNPRSPFPLPPPDTISDPVWVSCSSRLALTASSFTCRLASHRQFGARGRERL